MNIEIIKQTKDYLVLNKPSGISMHKDGKREEYTLADWLLENFPETEGIGENLVTSEGIEIQKPGIVHRLDKDTSGIVLVTLNQDAYEYFKAQFKDREIRKMYRLFAYGNIREDILRIDASIGKDKNDFRKRTTRNPRGKTRDAITNVRVLTRGKDKDEPFVFVEARPRTGRMHQIRVHMRHISSPIVCDRLYSPKRKPLLGFSRLALHARELIFKDMYGVEEILIAQYPEDFDNAIKSLDI